MLHLETLTILFLTKKTAIEKKKTKTTKNSKIALLAIVLFSPVFFSLGISLQVQEQKTQNNRVVRAIPFSPSIELETKQSLSATDFSRTGQKLLVALIFLKLLEY